MEGQAARSTTQKRRKPVQESRTKFDKWLDSKAEKGENLTFKCYENPRTWMVEGRISTDPPKSPTIVEARVLVVDRYNLLLSFEGHQIWVAKENICSCR